MSKPQFNDRIIREGFPEDWFVQDRLDSNEALLCQKYWLGVHCVCVRPRAMTTDDWLPTARRIADALNAEPQQVYALNRAEELADQVDHCLLGYSIPGISNADAMSALRRANDEFRVAHKPLSPAATAEGQADV